MNQSKLNRNYFITFQLKRDLLGRQENRAVSGILPLRSEKIPRRIQGQSKSLHESEYKKNNAPNSPRN